VRNKLVAGDGPKLLPTKRTFHILKPGKSGDRTGILCGQYPAGDLPLV